MYGKAFYLYDFSIIPVNVNWDAKCIQIISSHVHNYVLLYLKRRLSLLGSASVQRSLWGCMNVKPLVLGDEFPFQSNKILSTWCNEIFVIRNKFGRIKSVSLLMTLMGLDTNVDWTITFNAYYALLIHLVVYKSTAHVIYR